MAQTQTPIPEVQKGKTPTLLDAATANALIRRINALSNIEVIGGHADLTDANLTITVDGAGGGAEKRIVNYVVIEGVMHTNVEMWVNILPEP